MAILAFVDLAPGSALPAEVTRILGTLRAEGIPVAIIPGLSSLSEEQLCQVSSPFFVPELQAVLVFAGHRTAQDCATYRDRILQLRLLFPDEVKMLIDEALSFAPAGCMSVSREESQQLALASHGKFSVSVAGSRWQYRAGQVVEVVLSTSPCDGVCAACPRFSTCDWGAIPTWGRYTQGLRQAFVEQLSQAIAQQCVGLHIRDFLLGSEAAKLAWVGEQVQAYAPGLPWVADLSLDHVISASDCLPRLARQGLVGINLDIVSLHTESRQACGGRAGNVRGWLAEVRAMAPRVAIHGRLAIGLPGDTVDRVMDDFSWLLSEEGRSLVDSVELAAQPVEFGTILAQAGQYCFDSGTGAWRLPGIHQRQAEVLADRLNASIHKLNPVIACWPTASELLASQSVGLGYAAGLQLLRSGWAADETRRDQVRRYLNGLRDSYMSDLMAAIAKETYL